MKENAFASIIIYIKNNANEIPEVLPSLDNLMADHFENYEIIVVNDASRDESYYQIRKAAKGLKRDITLINLAWVHGPEKGIMAGVDHSIGDYVFEIEMSKINYPLGTLYELFTEAGKGFDIVSATPANKQSIGDLLFFKLFNKISYLPFDVYKETARIVSRRAINSILGMNEQIVYRKILYKFSGFPSKVLEYEPVAALSKSRGLSLKEKMRLAMDIFVSFSNIGTDLSVALSSFFLAISLLLGIYALSVYITQKGVVPGWTTQMLFMSICFSGVFMVLGLQSKYISAILLEARRRPNYTVHSVERYHGTQEEN